MVGGGNHAKGAATVTIMLDGEPTLDELATALGGFRSVLKAASKPKGLGDVVWEVEGLAKSSALITVRCRAATAAQATVACSRVIQHAREARSGVFSPPMARVLSVLGENVGSVRFESSEEDVILTSQVFETAGTSGDAAREMAPAFGAVRGKVQTVSNRGSLHFVLYDLQHDKAVSCYLEEGMEEQMRGVWGKLASVEGIVRRDATSGRPLTIRGIQRVEVVDAAPAGTWRDARGVLAGVTDEPAEDIVRRLRSV